MVEQAGGVVPPGGQGPAEKNNHGEPEAAVSAACAPKAAAVPASLPRHRRSKRSVSAVNRSFFSPYSCFVPPDIWSSKFSMSFNFAGTAVLGAARPLTRTRRRASIMAPLSNAAAKLPSLSLHARPRFTPCRTRRTRGGPEDRFTRGREITGPTRRQTTACRWRMT